MNIKDLMVAHGFQIKKRFGQNFLMDGNILRKIVHAAQLDDHPFVIEVGPGFGVLTRELAAACQSVVCIELDRDLVEILRGVLTEQNVALISGDALEFDWGALLQRQGLVEQKAACVANLPYYASTPLLIKALEHEPLVRLIVVMVQREVAERMTAAPGSKKYGVLSLVVQYFSHPEIVFGVSPGAFFPQPDVDSAVVRMQKIPPPVSAPKKELFQVIKAAFGQRRKTMRNALRPVLASWSIDSAILDRLVMGSRPLAKLRAETLDLEEFSYITEELLAASPNSRL